MRDDKTLAWAAALQVMAEKLRPLAEEDPRRQARLGRLNRLAAQLLVKGHRRRGFVPAAQTS